MITAADEQALLDQASDRAHLVRAQGDRHLSIEDVVDLAKPWAQAILDRQAEEVTGPPSPLMTVAEVAAALRVSRMTVYRMVDEHALTALTVGRSIRVHRDVLDRYVAENTA